MVPWLRPLFSCERPMVVLFAGPRIKVSTGHSDSQLGDPVNWAQLEGVVCTSCYTGVKWLVPNKKWDQNCWGIKRAVSGWPSWWVWLHEDLVLDNSCWFGAHPRTMTCLFGHLFVFDTNWGRRSCTGPIIHFRGVLPTKHLQWSCIALDMYDIGHSTTHHPSWEHIATIVSRTSSRFHSSRSAYVQVAAEGFVAPFWN